MSVIGSNILAGASGQGGDYTIARSLRFRDSASAYLSRTPASAGNRKTWTWSAWVKRGSINRSGQDYSLFVVRPSAGSYTLVTFRHSTATGSYGILFEDSGVVQLLLQAVNTDPSAWYHIVIAVDTTQATSSNRVKIYVNNQQITSWDTYNTFPSLNADTLVNSTNPHNIGRDPSDTANLFDGYLTEVNFIDGQALTPSSFGETNAQTGVWQPKRYAGTYGTNGFYLPFTDNSALTSGSNAGLGKDFSGNGNYWNTNNISITSGSTYDSMTDVPTLTSATASNFAVLNPLNFNGSASASNGNLTFGSSVNDVASRMTGTIAVTSGKWYFEATRTDAEGVGNQLGLGVGNTDSTLGTGQYSGNPTSSGSNSNEWVLMDRGIACNNTTYTNLSGTLGTIAQNDVVQVCVDMDSKKIWFGKNNTFSGSPSAGTGEVFSNLPTSVTPLGYNYNGVFAFNFGQRPFAYTPPTGFVALNTFNLPTPTIGATASTQANKYFDAITYTGQSGTKTITTAGGFSPDFVWIKNRTSARWHSLYDQVRGANKRLFTNATDAEQNDTGYNLNSFTSTGFTLLDTDRDTNSSAGDSYVAWCWDANGSGSSNTAGSITSTVSANTSAGFSVVTYTGTGSAATIGHGLGVAPAMVMVKSRSNNTGDGFITYHKSLPSASYWLDLASTAAQAGPNSVVWNGTAPTSTVFSVGTASGTNTNTYTYVAYCFAPVAGYSAFTSYTGNGSTDGTFCYLGFKPRFIMIKRTDSTSDWSIYDTARDTYNYADKTLMANLSNAESVIGGGLSRFDFLSNGFKVRGADSYVNASGGTYIVAAFAENPFKYSLGR